MIKRRSRIRIKARPRVAATDPSLGWNDDANVQLCVAIEFSDSSSFRIGFGDMKYNEVQTPY